MLAEMIIEQTDHRPKNQVAELILDGWECRELTLSDKNQLEQLAGLEFLSMNGCGLTSLKNFPVLPELLKLDLNENRLTGGLRNLSGLQKLMQLGLAGNAISDVTEVDALECIPSLLALNTTNCPVAATAGYRAHVFEKLDNLSVLDKTDEMGHEVTEEEESDLDSQIDEEDLQEEIDSESESSGPDVRVPVRRYRPEGDSDSESSDENPE